VSVFHFEYGIGFDEIFNVWNLEGFLGVMQKVLKIDLNEKF